MFVERFLYPEVPKVGTEVLFAARPNRGFFFFLVLDSLKSSLFFRWSCSLWGSATYLWFLACHRGCALVLPSIIIVVLDFRRGDYGVCIPLQSTL